MSDWALLPLAGSSPIDLCLGPDGNVWVLDNGNNGVWRVTTLPAVVATFYSFASVDASASIRCITTDGTDLWVLDGNTRAAPGLIKITTAGVVSRIAISPGFQVGDIPTNPSFGSSDPTWLYGPDGNFWTCGANNIYRITPGGSLTHFALSDIVGMAADSTYIYVTSGGSPLIVGKYSTSGVLQSGWPVSIAGTPPAESPIVQGGFLWGFANSDVSTVDTSSGAYTLYSMSGLILGAGGSSVYEGRNALFDGTHILVSTTNGLHNGLVVVDPSSPTTATLNTIPTPNTLFGNVYDPVTGTHWVAGEIDQGVWLEAPEQIVTVD